MPGAARYPLFAQAHLQVACVVTATGRFRGLITRQGLAEKTSEIERLEVGVGGTATKPSRQVLDGSVLDEDSEGSDSDSDRAA